MSASSIARRRARMTLLGLGALAAWVTWVALRDERLPLGSAVPHVRFMTGTGVGELSTSNGSVLVVLLFRTTCSACGDELKQLEPLADRLGSARLVFLSPESLSDIESFAGRWPALSARSTVRWGMLVPDSLDDAFGRSPTPTALVFGSDGRLMARLIGEVTPDSLFRTIARGARPITPPTVGALHNREQSSTQFNHFNRS